MKLKDVLLYILKHDLQRHAHFNLLLTTKKKERKSWCSIKIRINNPQKKWGKMYIKQSLANKISGQNVQKTAPQTTHVLCNKI